MLPIRDNIKSNTFPFITIGLIIANSYFFFQEMSLDDRHLENFIMSYGLVPAAFIKAISRNLFDITAYIPLITNLFLHGGWMHIIGNMWYVWIFGDNVEDRLGHFRFLAFYFLCGIAANMSHILIDPASTVPTIGASGAVSGILGAYLVTFPWARILTLIPIFIFIQFIEIPALIFLGLWFFIQLQYGTASLLMTGTNIAWWAHIGGFVTGMLLIKLIAPPRPKWRY